MTTVVDTYWVELDGREADGLDVHLLWSPKSGTLKVVVYDNRTEEVVFDVPVQPDQAVEAFNHPFAYAVV